MLRLSAGLLLVFCLASGCGRNIKTKELVQAAILARLETTSGLDLKTIDVAITSVSFEKNNAYATVAFHPKGDPSLSGGMQMTYTLEDRDGKWAVVKVGDSSGHGITGQPPASTLPPGHPPVNQTTPMSGGGTAQ